MRYDSATIKKGMVCILATIICFHTVADATDLPLKDKFSGTQSSSSLNSNSFESMEYPFYSELQAEYQQKQYTAPAVDQLVLEADQIIAPNGNPVSTVDGYEQSNFPVFIWNNATQTVTWQFDIVESGLYQIEMDYYMPLGKDANGVRKLFIDGKIPCWEAQTIEFYRYWKDYGEKIINSVGDEIAPLQTEEKRWSIMILEDSFGYYGQPLSFYFEKGQHTISMEYVEQDIAIGQMRIYPQKVLTPYQDLQEEYQQKGYQQVEEQIRFEAEDNVIEKNTQLLRALNDGDPMCTPYSTRKKLLNTMGGYSWKNANQSITWKFTVKQSGLYKLSMRIFQGWNDGLSSYRQVLIDGEVPFAEMSAYPFHYSSKWNVVTLSDAKQNPYLFYLAEGEHTLTLSVKMGEYTDVIQALYKDGLLLSQMILDIVQIAGQEPDINYDYQFFKKIPDLKQNMETFINSLRGMVEKLEKISGKSSAIANNLKTIIAQFENMLQDPFSIAKNMNDISTAQTMLSTWFNGLQAQPLLIDDILLSPSSAQIENRQSNIFQMVWATLVNFAYSFTKDYDNVVGVIGQQQIKKTINVWIGRGFDWAELIKRLADQKFTSQTGIGVNINILPATQLNAGGVNAIMLAIASGNVPDAALSLDVGSPVEFAIRHAVVDLSKMNAFDKVKSQFLEQAFVPFQYDGGIYALPECMDFKVLIYRTDIIDSLNLTIPETREELYEKVLPVLYQNGMQFYYPRDDSSFLYQYGGSFYTQDGKRTGLDTPEAFQAFKEEVELYTNYGIPVQAEFYNRFRTGQMPMGIGTYATYMMILTAAPELAGRWNIALMPGRRLEDGSVSRKTGNVVTQGDVILSASDNQNEAWEFIKWWMSTDIQYEFSKLLEGTVGRSARWNSANLEAFNKISWNPSHLSVINSMWKEVTEVPVVLGGYFTSRHLNNAWNSCVVQGVPLRDALEKACKDINRELTMKQKEYGFGDSE